MAGCRDWCFQEERTEWFHQCEKQKLLPSGEIELNLKTQQKQVVSSTNQPDQPLRRAPFVEYPQGAGSHGKQEQRTSNNCRCFRNGYHQLLRRLDVTKRWIYCACAGCWVGIKEEASVAEIADVSTGIQGQNPVIQIVLNGQILAAVSKARPRDFATNIRVVKNIPNSQLQGRHVVAAAANAASSELTIVVEEIRRVLNCCRRTAIPLAAGEGAPLGIDSRMSTERGRWRIVGVVLTEKQGYFDVRSNGDVAGRHCWVDDPLLLDGDAPAKDAIL